MPPGPRAFRKTWRWITRASVDDIRWIEDSKTPDLIIHLTSSRSRAYERAMATQPAHHRLAYTAEVTKTDGRVHLYLFVDRLLADFAPQVGFWIPSAMGPARLLVGLGDALTTIGIPFALATQRWRELPIENRPPLALDADLPSPLEPQTLRAALVNLTQAEGVSEAVAVQRTIRLLEEAAGHRKPRASDPSSCAAET